MNKVNVVVNKNSNNLFIGFEKRKYVVIFLFQHEYKARQFKLPKEYDNEFELNNNVTNDGSLFVRVAQIKVTKKHK